MSRRLVAVIAAALVLAFVGVASASDATSPTGTSIEESSTGPRLRALLMGFDQFISQPSTGQTAANSMNLVATALREDARVLASLRFSYQELLDAPGLRARVWDAFEGARPQDLNILYINTHGLYEPGKPPDSFRLLVSDGETEGHLDGAALRQAFEGLPGQSILIIDSCNSGALIGKGLSGGPHPNPFVGTGLSVLTAAGGNEPGYLWLTEGAGRRGASFFAEALSRGLQTADGAPADQNRDRVVTLAEMLAYLLENAGPSTPHLYPERDQRPLGMSVADAEPHQHSLKALIWQDRLLSLDNPAVHFEYTLQRPQRMAYQVVYDRDGAWRFDQAQLYQDEGGPDGLTPAGTHERDITWGEVTSDMFGYVLIAPGTVHEDRFIPRGMGLVAVQPESLSPDLSVTVYNSPSPRGGIEMQALIAHKYPIVYHVQLVNADGQRVAYLKQSVQSRPERLSPMGSSFYWDGLLPDGTKPESGWYKLSVRTRVKDQSFEALSDRFWLE